MPPCHFQKRSLAECQAPKSFCHTVSAATAGHLAVGHLCALVGRAGRAGGLRRDNGSENRQCCKCKNQLLHVFSKDSLSVKLAKATAQQYSSVSQPAGTTPCRTVICNRSTVLEIISAQEKLFGASCKTVMLHFLTRPTAIFNKLSNY